MVESFSQSKKLDNKKSRGGGKGEVGQHLKKGRVGNIGEPL